MQSDVHLEMDIATTVLNGQKLLEKVIEMLVQGSVGAIGMT